jgi:hypothetical protein
MNEETQNEIRELIQTLNGALQTGIDTAVIELPLFAQEIIYWGMLKGWTLSLLFLFVILFTYYKIPKWINLQKIVQEKYWADKTDKITYVPQGTPVDIGYAVFFGFVSLLMGLFLIKTLPMALQATFAPRLYLLDYLRHLL